jgi:hypothetical protein
MKRAKNLLVLGQVSGGGGAPALDYLLDTFTGANGTLLGAHETDTGQDWTVVSNNFEITSNQARVKGTSSGDVCMAVLESPFGADVTVEAHFTRNNVSGYEQAILGRYVDANNHWKVRSAFAGNGFQIIQVEGGSETIRAFSNTLSDAGVEYLIRAVFSGNSIIATFGASTIQYLSASFQNTATKFGIKMQHHVTAGQKDDCNDFLIWEGAGDPPPNPLYPFP